MQIALDQIDFLPTTFRRSPEPDAAFVESINTQGVLQPVLLRPAGNRYEVVKGERRVRAARLAGLAEIPAHIDANLIGHHATVARLAATMARRPLTTTEQWRALCTLTDEGMPADTAAVSIGLDRRTARQMERLGRLHPELLAEYERIEAEPDRYMMPEWSDLGIIAAAPQDDQIGAARANGYPDDLDWEYLAIALRKGRQRIPREWALFHHDMLPWTEDYFAEPGTAMQFTTEDTEGFLAAQRLALADLANASKGRIQVGDGWGWHKVPKGWSVDAWCNEKPGQLAKTDKRTIFAWIETSGATLGRVSWAIAKPTGHAPAPSARERDEEDATAELDRVASLDDDPDAVPSQADDDDSDGTHPAAPEPEPEAKLPLTKHGQALLAKARTEALRAALRSGDTPYSYDDVLRLLVIALAAGTVTVKNGHGTYSSRVDMRDLAGRLMDEHGHLRQDIDPGRVAQEALARMLCLPEPDEIGGYNQAGADSARIPLAIGAIVGADQHLPRLDTETFLATVAGPDLKAWAKGEGMKLSKVTEIRTRMAGRAESWRPTWALFDPASATEGQGA